MKNINQNTFEAKHKKDMNKIKLWIIFLVVLSFCLLVAMAFFPCTPKHSTTKIAQEKKEIIKDIPAEKVSKNVTVYDVIMQMDPEDGAYVGNLIIDQYAKDFGKGTGALNQIFSTNNDISVVVGYISWKNYDAGKLYEISKKYKGVMYKSNSEL